MEQQLLDQHLHLLSYQPKHNFLDQVRIISTSQLINGISKFLQKLFKYFNGITTSAFVNESLSCGVFPAILVLYLKDSELVKSGSLC